jgi:hypothetical protein
MNVYYIYSIYNKYYDEFFYQHVSEYLLETAGNLIVSTLAFSRL